MANYTQAEKTTIRDSVDAGVPWATIAKSLGRSQASIEACAREMRDAGEWPENPDSVRELPDGPGRPRNRRRTASVSVRFAPSTAAAVRAVAERAGFGRRVGKVLDEAIDRALQRAENPRLRSRPFGLAKVARELPRENKTETISASVDAEAFDALVKLGLASTPTTAVHDATTRLLRDLGYKLSRA